jgi:hypothetical protein
VNPPLSHTLITILLSARPAYICLSLGLSCRSLGKRAQGGPTCSPLPTRVSLFPFQSASFQNRPRIALYELMSGFIMPLCSHLHHPTSPAPVSSAMTIIDLKDVTLGSIWNLRSHLQEASALATSNYPETLNTTAIVNSPPFFPTIWSWIKVRSNSGLFNFLIYVPPLRFGSMKVLGPNSTYLAKITAPAFSPSSTVKTYPKRTGENSIGLT